MKTASLTALRFLAGFSIACAHAADAPRYPADFAAECSAISDPADINVFSHEDIVNSFLGVKGAFGMGRVIRMPYNHDHFAKHGGTFAVPTDRYDDSHLYQLREWGMIGGIDTGDLTLYFLKMKGFGEADKMGKTDELSDRPVNAFESYAVQRLQKGDQVVKWDRPEFTRYVGAIRAAASCLSCHADAKEGDVLGAFAYDYKKLPLPRDHQPDPFPAAVKAGKSTTELGKIGGKRQSYEIRQALLTAGVVTPTMVSTQLERRKQVIEEAVQLNRSRIPSSLRIRPAPSVAAKR